MKVLLKGKFRKSLEVTVFLRLVKCGHVRSSEKQLIVPLNQARGEDKTQSPTPWRILWSTSKNHLLVKLNTYQHDEAFRCTLPLFL